MAAGTLGIYAVAASLHMHSVYCQGGKFLHLKTGRNLCFISFYKMAQASQYRYSQTTKGKNYFNMEFKKKINLN